MHTLRKTIFIFLCIFCVNAFPLDREYSLIYFKFFPSDLKIKVFIDNSIRTTPADKTDYFIARIDNQKGEAKIFLLDYSRLERDKYNVKYQYKIVFYKTQKILKKTVDTPVYFFKVSFGNDEIQVKYPDGRENSFLKDPIADTYYLTDENGKPFDLSKNYRLVKLVGKLLKVEGNKTNYLDLPENVRIKLVRKEDDLSFKNIDEAFEVPVNREFIIGHFPYEIEVGRDTLYKPIALIIESNIVSGELLIHFREVWKYPYEQIVIFERDPRIIEFLFENELYNLFYKVRNNKLRKWEKESLLINTQFYTNAFFLIKLSAKGKALEYLDSPYYSIKFEISYDSVISNFLETLEKSYPEKVKIVGDNQVLLLPDVKTTPFSFFSEPENAEITLDLIEPILKWQKFSLKLSSTPVFLNSLPYGRYKMSAVWYSDNGEIINKVEKNLLISETSLKEGEKYGIRTFRNRDVKIPYFVIEKQKIKESEGSRKRYLEKIDMGERENLFKHYYIQIAACRTDSAEKSMRILKKIASNFKRKYYKIYGSEEFNFIVARKKVRGRGYEVLLDGPYSNNEAKLKLSKFVRLNKDVFIVKKDDVVILEEF